MDRVRRQQLTFSKKYLIWFIVQRQDGHVVQIPNYKTQPRSPVANKKVITNKPRITYMPTCTCIQLNVKIKLAISFMYMHIHMSNIRIPIKKDHREKCVFRFVFLSFISIHAYNGHVTLPPFYGTFTQNVNAMTSKKCFRYTCSHQSKYVWLVDMNPLFLGRLRPVLVCGVQALPCIYFFISLWPIFPLAAFLSFFLSFFLSV